MVTHEVIEAYVERLDQVLIEMWEAANKGRKYPWTTLNLTRAKRIWNDFMKFGFVRDVKGLENIADEVVDKIVKIDAMTILGGHTPQSPLEVLRDLVEDITLSEDELFDLLEDYLPWKITDYALEPLQKLAVEILGCSVPEVKILAVDQVFNVVHQTSDIASWFVKGGRLALEELGGNDNERSTESDNQTF